jgi:hypothetical protein
MIKISKATPIFAFTEKQKDVTNSCRMILTSNHSTEYTSYEKHDIP